MYIYSVSIHIDNSAEQEWLQFMQEKHIADVINTGYFSKAIMRKAVSDDKLRSSYNIEYYCNDQDAYQAYLEKSAAIMRKDVMDRFEGKFSAERIFYEEIFEV